VSRESKTPPPSADGLLHVNRLASRLRDRYEHETVPERFRGLPTIEDLPLYAWTRRLLKAAAARRPKPAEARPLGRPDWMDRRLEDRTPQFSLRNVRRAVRPEPGDESPFQVVAIRDRAAEEAVGEVRRLRYQRPKLLEHWNLADVTWLRELLRSVVFVEPWTRRFGRELKEHVQGPLWRYDPDGESPDVTAPCSSSSAPSTGPSRGRLPGPSCRSRAGT
jgi:hypothetical protein